MHFHGRALIGASLALFVGLAACGSTASRSGSSSRTTVAAARTIAEGTLPGVVAGSSPSSAPPVVTLPTPTVQIPATIPTKLVTTDLKPGSGDPAAAGDTVVINYVGVTSKDGKTFDESYSKGKPFPVVLGQGSVIKGWDQGLIGATTGMRRQLDIPADLAYGTAGQGSIGPNEALSFVIDVVAVVKASIAPVTDKPATFVTKDIVVGTGATLKEGQSITINEVVYRGDTGAQLASTWQNGSAATGTYSKDKLLPGVYEGVAGMQVGGTRQITVQAGQALGDANVTQASLAIDTTLVFIVDLVAAN